MTGLAESLSLDHWTRHGDRRRTLTLASPLSYGQEIDKHVQRRRSDAAVVGRQKTAGGA